MKAIRNIFLALALLGTVSCGNDWLELDPSTAVNTDEAVKTLKEVEFTMNGIYNMMRTSDLYSGRMMYYGDVTGDDMQAVSSSKRTGSYYRFSFTRDNGPSSHWSGLYQIIQNANLVLSRVDGIKVSEDDEQWRDNLKGEALAVRSLALFDLTRFFGVPYMKDNGTSLGVPIVTTLSEIDAKPARSTVAQCYAQFVGDLEDAVELMSPKFAKGRMNKWAAMSLLARAYLYMGEDAKALKAAEDAIAGAEENRWALWSNKDYPTAWSDDASAAAPGEILFEMVINTVESQGKETMGRLNSKDGYDDMCITVSFYHLLMEDPDDVRLKLLSFDKKKYAYVYKYQPQAGEDIMDANVPVIRLSETYLIAAEAAVKTGDNDKAVKYLDAIVSRANPAKTVVGTTVTLDDVMQVRRKELVAEGHRMFDVIRNGGTVKRIDEEDASLTSTRHFASDKEYNWDFYKIILPIPKAERDANPNVAQNPGYDN